MTENSVIIPILLRNSKHLLGINYVSDTELDALQ